MVRRFRTREQHNPDRVKAFVHFCEAVEDSYLSIKFWCGRNLYDWKLDYAFCDLFSCEELSCEETYGSVIPGKKWLYGWWPWLYARTHNKAIKAKGTDKDILLIDYVDI